MCNMSGSVIFFFIIIKNKGFNDWGHKPATIRYGTIDLSTYVYVWQIFVIKNLGWSPIRELLTPAGLYTQVTECKHHDIHFSDLSRQRQLYLLFALSTFSNLHPGEQYLWEYCDV